MPLNEPRSTPARRWPPKTRLALLSVHIMVSVGLLGDSAGFLAVAMRLAATTDSAAAHELLGVLQMFTLVFGIPLSFAALLSGAALGFGTKWGLFRYPWVVAKLCLIVSVMAVGGLVIGPAVTSMLAGGADASRQLVAAGWYDVSALGLATVLSVFKPGRAFRTVRVAENAPA